MFGWLEDIIEALGDLLSDIYEGIGEVVSKIIWDTMLRWVYETIYGAIADFFTSINNYGAEMFDLGWIQAAVRLFVLFGWALFITGTAVAVFDVAIEYQHGRANIRSCCLNILKGFFACSMLGTVPIALYKFSITLQNTFSKDLINAFIDGQASKDYSTLIMDTLKTVFFIGTGIEGLLMLLYLIAFGYCTVKLFFANIKRGGILLIQIAIGSLYMFSVPRGYTDGFNQWCKQVIALCFTAFMQTTLMFLGLLTMTDSLALGTGIMLAANEVPKIAQQFGLDSSVHVNVTSMVHTACTSVNLARMVGGAKS